MDWLDRIALGALAALVAASVALIYGHAGDAPSGRALQQTAAAASAPHEDLTPRFTVIRNLIEGGDLPQAEAMVRELKQRYPYEAELSMLMGDVLMRKQEPVKAMEEYKTAIELNPDYLDKKTPQFQGKKLKVAVGEALAEIDRRLGRNPDDAALKAEKKTVYYLYRKIAGSCG